MTSRIRTATEARHRQIKDDFSESVAENGHDVSECAYVQQSEEVVRGHADEADMSNQDPTTSTLHAGVRASHEVVELPRPAPSRPQRPSAAHPAQAAVERAALLEAVENRAVIEQAKGMLMLKHRCDADSAFGLLVEISRRERRKVRDIAGDIVRSGTRPRRVVDVTDAAVTSGRVADQARVR